MRSEINGGYTHNSGQGGSGSADSYSGVYRDYGRGQAADRAQAVRSQSDNEESERDRKRRSEITRATLEQTIENEAIPRLLLARKEALPHSNQNLANEPAISRATIDAFLILVRTKDISAALSFIESLQQQGTDIESIWLDLLGPTAAELGAMWERDEIDFLEVTLGTWRLYEILRSTTTLSNGILESRTPKRRILMKARSNNQ